MKCFFFFFFSCSAQLENHQLSIFINLSGIVTIPRRNFSKDRNGWNGIRAQTSNGRCTDNGNRRSAAAFNEWWIALHTSRDALLPVCTIARTCTRFSKRQHDAVVYRENCSPLEDPPLFFFFFFFRGSRIVFPLPNTVYFRNAHVIPRIRKTTLRDSERRKTLEIRSNPSLGTSLVDFRPINPCN